VANEYLSKGSPVLIEGRLKLHTWEKEGQKHSKLRVTCERMQMLSGKPGAGGSGRAAGGSSSQFGGEPAYEEPDQFAPAGGPPQGDEIPF
jgi:single-strand DNA-binding protein